MYIITGLGNPGQAYQTTRHNIGWMVLDTLRAKIGASEPELEKRHQARISRMVIAEEEVWCVYPQTFMNNSGFAVRGIWDEHREATLVVVHDEVALPLGDLKISYERGHGGHNGVRNIINHCRTKAFVRIRMGVASRSWWSGEVQTPHGDDRKTFVLRSFSLLEQRTLTQARERGAAAAEAIVNEGFKSAMNTCNISLETWGEA